MTPRERDYLWEMLGRLDLSAEELSQLKALIGALELPKAFSLSQNYPNPFNPFTTISYAIPEGLEVQVRLEIFNLRGQLVKVLVDEVKEAGEYLLYWDGKNTHGREVSSGVSFFRIRAGEFDKVRKMVVLR